MLNPQVLKDLTEYKPTFVDDASKMATVNEEMNNAVRENDEKRHSSRFSDIHSNVYSNPLQTTLAEE